MVRRIETEGSGLEIANVEGKRMEMISEREREEERELGFLKLGILSVRSTPMLLSFYHTEAGRLLLEIQINFKFSFNFLFFVFFIKSHTV